MKRATKIFAIVALALAGIGIANGQRRASRGRAKPLRLPDWVKSRLGRRRGFAAR